jgi:medium-chain acyl-[acyl-carrier-protein] hydrolase
MSSHDSTLQNIWLEKFLVHSYEVDRTKMATVPSLCQYMQEAAWHHAEHLGVGFEALQNRNLAWVLYAQIIRFDNFPHWDDDILVKTWPSGRERLFFERDFQVLSDSDEKLAAASTRWLVIDMASRRPQRIDFPYRSEIDFLEHAIQCEFVKFNITPDSGSHSFKVDYFDLDVNSHVNNVRYIEWILKSNNPDFHHGHRLRELEIHYIAEALYGEEIEVKMQQLDQLNYYHVLRSMPAGKELCRARTQWLNA